MKTLYSLLFLITATLVAAPPDGAEDTELPNTVRSTIPIRAGDMVRISMKEDPDLQVEAEVSAEGLIDVPYLGRFSIGDQLPETAETALETALTKDLYQSATVALTVLKRAPAYVYVYGAVKQPGKVTLPENQEMTILQALAEADGITSWSTPRDAYILRRNGKGGREKIMINIITAFENIAAKENRSLQPQDVIVVPSATGTASVLSTDPMEVIVTGQVKEPGLVTFAPGEQRTFIRAIFKAGDFTRFANREKVRFIRYHKGGKREVREVNAEEIIDKGQLEKDFDLEAGDMIIVDEKRFNF